MSKRKGRSEENNQNKTWKGKKVEYTIELDIKRI